MAYEPGKDFRMSGGDTAGSRHPTSGPARWFTGATLGVVARVADVAIDVGCRQCRVTDITEHGDAVCFW